MKRFLLGLFVAISLSVYGATVLWPNGAWLETFQNGFLFGNGSIFSALDGVPTFDNRRLDDRSNKIFFQEDYEGASVSFTCGTNLTAADETTDEIAGVASKSFTQGATPPTVGVKCEGPTITLDPKEQDKNLIEVCFNSTWTGNDNEMQFNVYDNTAAADILNLPITASTTPKEHCGYFQTSGTASIDYDIEVLVQNASDELIIDDIEFRVDPLTPTDIYASSDWEDCGMTASDFSASFGSVTAIEDICKRDGSDLLISVKFVPGTITGLAAEVTPRFRGGTIVTKNIVGARIQAGSHQRDAAIVASDGIVLISGGASIIEFGPTNSTGAGPYSARPADEICTTGASCGFEARIPIEGWSDTAQGVVVKNRTDSASVENVFSAKIENNGTTASIVSQNVDFIDSVTRTSLGIVDVVFKPGVFSVAPSITVVPSDSPFYIAGVSGAVTTSGFTVEIKNNTTGANSDEALDFKVQRQGTDYVKETDKVYTVPISESSAEYYGVTWSTTNFWDSTTSLEDNWDTSLIQARAGSPLLANSELIEINDTTETRIVAKKTIELDVSISNTPLNSGCACVQILDSSGNIIAANQDSDTYDKTVSVSIVLQAGDYIYARNNAGSVSRSGGITIKAKPAVVQAVYIGNSFAPTCYVRYNTPSNQINFTGTTATIAFNETEGDCSFLSLSSGEFSLEKGSYNVEWGANIFHSNTNRAGKTTLYDVTGTSDIRDGAWSSCESATSMFCHKVSSGMGRINNSSISNTYSLRATDLGGSTGALSIGSNGATHVEKAWLKITKVR
jgi:hypothetical protein